MASALIVTPYAEASTAPFGPASLRSRVALTFTITSNSGDLVAITAVNLFGTQFSVDPAANPVGHSVNDVTPFLARLFAIPDSMGSIPGTIEIEHDAGNNPYVFDLAVVGVELPTPDQQPAVLVPLLNPPAASQRVFVRSRITRADGRLALPFQHRLDALPLPPWYSDPIAGEQPRFYPPGSAGGCRLVLKFTGDTRAAIFGSPAVWWINDTPNAPITRPNWFRGTALSSTTYVPADGTYYTIAMADSGIVAPVLAMGIYPQMVYLPRTIDQAFRLTGYRPLAPRAQNASTE